MIIRNGENPQIEQRKHRLGLQGDVYVYNEYFVESLDSHRELMAKYGFTSTAETIEEAEIEREAVEKELEERRAAEAAEKENESEDE